MDDTFVIWTGTKSELDTFLTFLNSINNHIQFTMEIEEDSKINFLDLTIRRTEENKLTYSIFRKPTQTDHCIPSDSNHFITHKLATFHSLIHRLFHVLLLQEAADPILGISGFSPYLVLTFLCVCCL